MQEPLSLELVKQVKSVEMEKRRQREGQKWSKLKKPGSEWKK